MPPTVTIRPWTDPVVDTLGYPAVSGYTEKFWLPTLGPSTLLLLRHLAARLSREPGGFDLAVAPTSQALGLGHREGRSSPLMRSFSRLVQFDLACGDPAAGMAVRTNVPPIDRRHIRRLPADLQEAHSEWAAARLSEGELAVARRRARRVAFALLEQGDDPDHVERVLHAIGFHPGVCSESTVWAHGRHRDALEAATRGLGGTAAQVPARGSGPAPVSQDAPVPTG